MHPVRLPTGMVRGLLKPEVARDADFLARYERDVLFYDAYWSADGKQIIVQGPPPVDLSEHYAAMRFIAQPSGTVLKATGHHSYLVQLYAMDAPPGTISLDLDFAGERLHLPVGANYSQFFAGQNLLFTLSKNNDLRWIADWARFHVQLQGATAVLLFDNNSTCYGRDEIEATLCAVPGLQRVAVVPVPFIYPIEDKAFPEHVFWAHFLQPAIIVNILRRYGMAARAILNADIDELFVPIGRETVFDSASRSLSGTVYYSGGWVAPVPAADAGGAIRHKDFDRMVPGTDTGAGGVFKWALAPNRRWLRNLKIHPYPHAIENRPPLTRSKPRNAFIAHFKAISTNWKYDRSAAEADASVPSAVLMAALAKVFG